MDGLAARLRRDGVGEVLTDTSVRALYSSDASLYRVVPQVVVRPRHADEVTAAVQACRREGLALTCRGGGTSVAGNAVGPGVILDFSRYLNRVLAIDPAQRTATVEPGVVQEDLQRAVAPYGLRFGPDPSSSNRCTIGGMIGNNACGTRALGYGRTSDNLVDVEVVTGSGDVLTLGSAAAAPQSALVQQVREITSSQLAVIRTQFGRFGRQMSGYALEHLLPENGFDVARFLVGSEGTLAVTTRATVRLVAQPPSRTLVVLGYPDIGSAGDAAADVRAWQPTACEGLDSRIVDTVRQRHGWGAVPPLPAGAAWLFVEIAGASDAVVRDTAQQLGRSCAEDAVMVTDAAAAAQLWRIRSAGAGLSSRTPTGAPAYAGWEDAAVPPQRLGSYLREFDTLLTEYGLTGLLYGHFGDGCLHIRLDFPLERPEGPEVLREFVYAAATQVAAHGGSLSGEHGDGRARSELLPLLYSQPALDVFAAVKHAFDPDAVLNPGVLVAPAPLASDLRAPAAAARRDGLGFQYRDDDGNFTRAVGRCTGMGVCRADNTGTGVMCPSYLATGEEKDTTRGRARALQEMIDGRFVTGGWSAPEVHEALDLCLSCKGCRSDCPTGVDMARYKSEVLYQAYRRRLRPVSHYTLGRLPQWARLAARMPRAANAVLRNPRVAHVLLSAAGVDPRRTVPAFAPTTFRSWFAATASERATTGDPVLLFVDTFTDYFAPEIGQAAVFVLQAAGLRPMITPRPVCCGLTWLTTGQLPHARATVEATLEALKPAVQEGIPIVGLEPSCTAVLASDALDLVGDAAAGVAEHTMTLAQLLAARDWQPPSLAGISVVAQPHCHHHAVLGWDADARLLARACAEVRQLSGCCGLAGNFGMEKGHYEISVAIAQQQLLPAVAAADADTVVLADGFSCRTQLADLSPTRGRHLAQLLAVALS